MKVAIVHYWFINWRGGEKVVEALLDLFPQADLFTHVYDESLTEGKLKGRNITTTFISKLPGAKKHYQKYLLPAKNPMATQYFACYATYSPDS